MPGDDLTGSIPHRAHAKERIGTRGQGATLWITGLPAAGKTTLGRALARELEAQARPVSLLDGDDLRRGVCADLGFDREGRRENARRTASLAAAGAQAGSIVVVALVSPYAADRRAARALHEQRDLPFIEVFLDIPLAECEQRDPKGLFAAARRGEIARFTGVDDPYEAPEGPEVIIRPDEAPDGAVQRVLAQLLRANARS